jgi:hypothetical protein
MSRPGLGALRRLGFAAILAATAAACSPAQDTLPTALPVAQPSAQAAAAPTGGAASALPSGALTDPAQAWPAFAACLRAHGLQAADPELDDNGDPIWAGDIKEGITRQIEADCGPVIAALEKNGVDGRNRPGYTYASELAHATCMREHGLPDWPDPNLDDREGGMPEGYDKADPTVYAGLVACERLLVEQAASPSPTP